MRAISHIHHHRPMNTQAAIKTIQTRGFIGHVLYGVCIAVKGDERDRPDIPCSLGKGVH